MKKHGERAHSKFSASGAERWFVCPGSVELSEGMPDKSSPWALEGTQAHEVLEAMMRIELSGNCGATIEEQQHILAGRPAEMLRLGAEATRFITGLHYRTPDSECGVEERIYLDFIHPEMFGTYDGRVVEHFGTLHVFDYKYGAGVPVSPIENLQMIFYAIGLAHKYHWNFKRVRLWIIQPRIRGYDGPVFWEIPTLELKRYVEKFQRAVERVEQEPDTYVEGGHCHWCKAKSVCPLKREAKFENAKQIFGRSPISGKEKGQKESSEKAVKEKSGETDFY